MNEVCRSEVHEAMKADPAVWESLDYVGVQKLNGAPYCVMRNCICGSTLAKLCSECGPEDGELH